MKLKHGVILAAALAILAAALTAGALRLDERTATGASGLMTKIVSAAPIGGPFTLTDTTGRTVTDRTYSDKYLLVFFGFTFCPDVCPTTLQDVARVMDLLGEDARRVQPVFVTVDPERDTPQAMARYVAAFHPAIVGLTGTPEQIAAVAKEYRAYYAKVPLEGGDYTMDHSAFLYLMAPDGRNLNVFAYQTPAEAVAETIRSQLDD